MRYEGQKKKNNKEQKCIPVGCMLKAAVATTRCQYSGGGDNPLGGVPSTQEETPLSCKEH